MTTDPTAKHHAQILDWLSAALTDPDTMMISLHQDADEVGTWEIHTDRKVDPAKEVAAASQADTDLLATYDEVAAREDDPQPYDFGGIRRDGYMGCTCPDCLALEKIMKGVDESAMKALDRLLNPGEVPPAFRPGESLKAAREYLKMKGGESMTDYLKRRYGQPDPAAWWERAGYLKPGQKVTNDSAAPVDWDAILSGGRWTTTDYGTRLEATFSGKAAEDLLLALYGFAGDDEAGVAYRADTPESIQKAKDDLFRTEDDR